MKYIVFFNRLSETALCTDMCSMREICLFLKGMKRGCEMLNSMEVKPILFFSFSRGTKPAKTKIKWHNVSHQRSPSKRMSAFFCIPIILLQSICRADRELEICHRVTPPRLPNGRYCIKNPKTKTEKKGFQMFVFYSGRFHKECIFKGCEI